MKSHFRLLITLICSCLLFCSCSMVFGEKTPLAVEYTVIRVTGRYVARVAHGKPEALATMIDWRKYLKNKGSGFTKEEFASQFDSSLNRWTREEHPLLGLAVLDLDVKGDDAEVILQKNQRTDYPKIWVQLEWSGMGWLVVDDSIFGDDGMMSSVETVVPAS